MTTSKIRIDGARGIRQDECFCADTANHARAKRYLGHCVAFVVMDPSFKNDNVQAGDFSKNDLASMSCNFGYGAMWNGQVVDPLGSVQNFIYSGQPAAHDDGYFGRS